MRGSERIIFALILGATPVAGPAFAFDGAPVNQDLAISRGFGPAWGRSRPEEGDPTVRARLLADLAAICRRRRPPDRAMEARADVRRRQWRRPGRFARLRIFQSDRQCACRRQSVGAAGGNRRQRLCGAGAVLSEGRYSHSKIKSDPERAREMFSYAASYFGNADAQYDLARLYLKGARVHPTISATARAGSRLPPRRASIRRRPCSDRCCSTATSCRVRRPAA